VLRAQRFQHDLVVDPYHAASVRRKAARHRTVRA